MSKIPTLKLTTLDVGGERSETERGAFAPLRSVLEPLRTRWRMPPGSGSKVVARRACWFLGCSGFWRCRRFFELARKRGSK